MKQKNKARKVFNLYLGLFLALAVALSILMARSLLPAGIEKALKLNEASIASSPETLAEADTAPDTEPQPLEKEAMLEHPGDKESTAFQTIEASVQSGDQDAQKRLISLLQHKDHMVQVEALAGLAEVGQGDALSLIAPLAEAEHPLLQRGSIMAIGGIGSRVSGETEKAHAIHLLKEIFERQGDSSTAEGNLYSIINALGRIKHPDALHFLAEKLEVYTGDPIMQASIVRSLEGIGSDQAKPVLSKLQAEITSKKKYDSKHLQYAYEDLKQITEEALQTIQ